jgi:SPP1 family predicted phage head-tail adaptor
MLRAGRLRHRVIVEELITGLDSDGEKTEDWLPVLDRPISAEIKPLSGRELIAANGAQSKVATRITVRWRDDFNATQRVRHRDTVYSIEAVVPDMVSGVRWATLLCTSGVRDG